MKSVLCLLMLIISACGVRHSSVHYGTTTVSDLVAAKGEPVQKQSIPVKDSEIYQYPNNENYQIKNDIVINGFKDPVEDERTLLFWKHKFKDCETVTTEIVKGEGHQFPVYELKCPKEGLSVVYTSGSEFVSRVIENEKE
jgi:hypothetical protein